MVHGVVKEFKPHVIVSDFEFYANLLSKIVKIPLISIDNISVLTQCELDVPKKYRGDRLKAEGVAYSFITMFFDSVFSDGDESSAIYKKTLTL